MPQKKPPGPVPSAAPDPIPGLSARELLDSGFDEDISSFDPDRAPSIDELKARRRPMSPEDRRVSDAALGWMASLPRDRRLMYTMLDYPHVVNTLADRWGDRQALAQYLDGLLHSRRRHRAGFSPVVQTELSALADWARSQGLLN